MNDLSENDIYKALATIKDKNGADIVAQGIVKGLQIKAVADGLDVSFALEAPASEAAIYETLRQRAEDIIRTIPGIAKVQAVLTAHKAVTPPRQEKAPLMGVKHIIAVASGKGGVGKSTMAVNLALAFAARGLKVGLLDADIYGPSIPRMLGLQGKPDVRGDKKLLPMMRYGMAVMSMGFLIAEEAPMIWRGPMVHGALGQMLREVAWNDPIGDLDILVVDMPPGTGDAQLTLVQQVPLAGAVIVSTPQDIALLDARRGVNMFRKVGVPILGMIENMSYFDCPHCGGRSDIFHHGGARDEAGKLGINFLGAVPLQMEVREMSDAGDPITHKSPNSTIAKIFATMADGVWNNLHQHP